MLSPCASSARSSSTLRRHHPIPLIAVVALLAVAATCLPAAAQIAPYETAREKGVLPEHGAVSFAPWETIDPWSGNVMLSFVDVALPGNAGFNLVVRRVYNSKDGGGWLFDIGMPHLQFTSSGYPIVINGDGSTMWLARPYIDVYMSTSFWRYNSSTGLLQSPAGITYTFDSSGRPLTATDPFNNQQTVTWVNGQIANIVQILGNGQRRQIDFTYDAQGNVASLACLSRTWFYTWSSGQLTQATSPAGPAWTFGYSRTTVGTEDQSAITVTTPTGGWVQYVSRKHLDAPPFGYDPRWDSFTVRSRQAGGTDVAAGTWQFTYPTDRTPTTTIEGTSGVTYHAQYTFLNNGAYWTVPLISATVGLGTAQQQINYTWQYGVLLGTTYFDYRNGQLVPFGPTHALLPTSETVTQSGRTYSRSYQYDLDDTVHFNHFGQPTHISSTGDFSSSTDLEYQSFLGNAYLGDKPASVEVNGISGSADYDPSTGFLLSHTARLLTTTFTPDPTGNGNVLTQTVNTTHVTTFDHSWGVVSSVTGPISAVIRTINPDGSVATSSKGGHVTTFSYDAAGRLTGVQPPVGNASTITYATDGTWVKRARGTAWTTTCLDGFGRTAVTFDGTGARVDVQYDALSRVIHQTLPYTTTPAPSSCSSPPASAPPTTAFAYDTLGRVTTRTNPDNTSVTYAFGSTTVGLRTTTTDELSHTTVQVFQASGSPSNTRLKSVTNAGNQPTTYLYDPDSGQLTQILAPNGLSKSWTYFSQLGLIHTETQPESGTTTYTYDTFRNVATRTDALGHTITYSYDAENRVIGTITNPATSYGATIHYDPSTGNRDSASNGYVTSHFDYDLGDRLTKRVDEISGHQFVTRLGYDDNDNLTDLWYPSGNHVSYLPDGNNRLIRVHDDSRGLEFANTFLYRPSGAIASYTSGNGIVNTVAYNDNTEQPTHIGSTGGVMDLTYGYDDAGRVTGIADARQGQNATYGYDALNRLHTANGPWGSLTYEYDVVSNRTQSTLYGTPTTTYSYSPTTNRLLSSTNGQQYEGFLHDNDGRLTQDGRIQTYTYTPQNLVEIAHTYAGAQMTYRYDADGQRVLKIAGSETSRTYVVNGLSEFSTEGGPIRWTVDYVSAGSRLLAAVRPAAGTLYQLTVNKSDLGAGRVTADPAGVDCGPDCTARYLSGTVVTLTATATDEYSSFTGWSGSCSGTASTATVTVDAAKTCVATFTRVTYTLTIQKTGDGSDDSWVTSSPSGIDCGATCAASIGGGATVQLTASPADGYQFLSWTGDGCTTGTFTMTGARTCTAVFDILPGCDPTGCQQADCENRGRAWDAESCSCHDLWEDPLVLTLDGKPIQLTDAAGGVGFDLDGSGARRPVAWTRAGSTAAFLVLDLDGDGAITTGAELFGMPVTAPRHQKPAAGENSFTLLAAYDDPANGGNGDGKISAADAVFNRLRLWVDTNHDGVSQPGELVPLAAAGVVSIELGYRVTGRRDGHGNFYRYRGVVHLSSGRRVPIWDVFLAVGSGSGNGNVDDGVNGPIAPDDEDGPVTGTLEEMGAGAGDDNGGAGTLGAGRLDPPPTPLQVVEYYHLDAIGSVRVVTDQDGQVIRRHDFLPFGEELSPQYPPHDRKLFTGQERDFETGLDYFHARQLRVDLGRFTAPDPLTDLAWTDDTLGASNSYSYVHSNPLGLLDPAGADDHVNKTKDGWQLICDDFGATNCAWVFAVTVPTKPLCSELRKDAAALGEAFDEVSTVTGWTAFGAGAGTLLLGLGEGPTGGLDTPLTLSLAGATEFLFDTSIVTGAIGASLESFAAGNTKALMNFNVSQLAGLAATAAATRVPRIKKWAERLGDLAAEATGIAMEAKGGCQ
jgi:RHS repeat-associated protein